MHLARSVAGVAVILAAAVGWGQSCPELGGWWELERETTALAISGHHAYLATFDGLTILDVSTPEVPVEVGRCGVTGTPVGIAVGGSTVVLATGATGLGVVDVSALSAPSEVGVVGIVGYAYAVVLAGDHAYVAAGEGGLRVFDFSVPSAPREVGAVNTHGPAKGIAVCGGLAFVAAGTAGLRVVDVSDPGNPVEVGAWEPPPGVMYDAHQVALSPGRSYVAGTLYNGFRLANRLAVLDISAPAAPALSGLYLGEQIGPYTGHHARIAVEGEFLYLLQGLGLEVVDVSSPAVPTRVGAYWYPERAGTIAASGRTVMASGVDPPRLGLFTGCGSHTLWIELVAHLQGLEGGEWRSDVAARNPGVADASLTWVLHRAGGDHQLTMTVPGQSQLVVTDLVGLMGLEGKGALEVRSGRPLQLVSRVYHEGAEGTFGQELEGRAASEGLDLDESGWLLGLRQESGLFRTNISITNAGAQVAHAEVTLFASDGTVLVTYLLSVEAGLTSQDHEPFARRADRPDLGWGFARVRVTQGSAILTSASVIDSRTNDASTVVMQPDPPAAGWGESLWVEIAAHLSGVAGSEWRSDVVVRNPGAVDLPFTFVLHTADGDHEHDAVVAAGAQSVFIDLVGSLGLWDKGALEVRCQSPLQVSSRTYTNGQSGTFGQSFVGRLGSTGLRRESGWLIGLRQEEGVFRTNLSVTNAGTEPARAVVTLFGADGVQLAGRYLLEVEAGMTVQDLEPFARRAARPDLGWGFARVEATQGSGLLTSASVIDSRSNDPTTVTMRR